MKQRILFATIMGLITTGVVSFTLVWYTRGIIPGFWYAWGKSWLLAYITAIPIIILLAPKVQQFVAYLCKPQDG